jgi:hypothetical protein
MIVINTTSRRFVETCPVPRFLALDLGALKDQDDLLVDGGPVLLHLDAADEPVTG